MVEIKVKSASPIGPPVRNVTFQENEPSADEEAVVKTVAELAGAENHDLILDIIRKQNKKCVNTNEYVNDITNKVFDRIKDLEEEEQKKCIIPSIVEPEVSTQTESMYSSEVIPYGPQNSTDKKYLTLEEDSDLQRALQESLRVTNPNLSSYQSSLPEDLETMIRNPNLSTGLHNAGNTCWFNCVAQILYHLPKFRSIIYHCVPYDWLNKSVPSCVTPETVLTRDLLLRIRYLFAEMQFSTMSFIDTTSVLEVVDALTRKNSSEISVLGQQQDATESLIRIIDWLDSGIKEAITERLNPPKSDDVAIVEEIDEEQSYIPANSVLIAPNSDIVGIAPPSYEAVSYTTIEGSSKDHFGNEQNSLVGGGINAIPSVAQSIKKNGGSRKNSWNEEPMDMSESVHLPPDFAAPPPPSLPNSHPNEAVSIQEIAAMESIKENMNKLFTSTCVTATYSDDISNSLPETTIHNCPQFFHLQASYGDLHDALEATTFDTGRGDTSHVQNFFDTLPAAIFMSISRFNYKNGMPEKLHNRFVFPKVLYMDRYMKRNAKKVLELRNEQIVDRVTLSKTRAIQRGLKNYPFAGNGTTRVADSIDTVLDVLRNTRIDCPPPPKSPNVLGPFVPTSACTSSEESGSLFIENLGTKYPEIQHNQYPGMNACLQTLQQISQRLKEDETVLAVQDDQLLEKINNTYEVEELKQCEYRLHALIIHSGEATRGHYWAYTRSQDDQWEKLNDKHIDIVPWSQVENDAYGNGNASSPSAYCLLYVKSDATWLMEPDTLTREEALELLPDDLKEMVSRKIGEFNTELGRFRDERIAAKTMQHSQAAATATTSSSSPKSIPVLEEEENFDLQVKKEQWGYDWHRNAKVAYANTASSSETFNLVTPLFSQQFEKFNPEAERQVKDSISRIDRVLRSVMPSKYGDESHPLYTQCDSLMMNYGKPFLRQILGFDPNELRADAENDANSAFDRFIAGFLHHCQESKNASSSLVTFIHTVIRSFNNSVIRFILLTALSRSRVTIIATRAKAELDQFKLQSPEQFVSINRLAQWTSMLYELLSVMVFSCRKSLEYFLGQMSERSKCTQNSYYGLLAARMARFSHQMLISEIRQFDTNPLNMDQIFDYEIVQVTTTLSLLTLSAEMAEHTINEQKSLHDLTFFMEGRERRITEDDLSQEVKFAINAIRIWVKNGIATTPDVQSNNCEIYQTLQYGFESMRPLRACSVNSDKLHFVNEAIKVFVGEVCHELDPLPHYFESESYGIPSENLMISERIKELISSVSMDQRFKKLINQFQRVISQIF